MSWLGALIMFAICWFVCLIVVLPRGLKTQGEVGVIEPGTPASAPAEINLRRKLLINTLITLIPWGIFCAIVEFQLLTLDDLDFLFPESFKEPPAALGAG